MEPLAQVVERVQTPRGELVLRRAGEHYEVIANGTFLMDSREVGSERALAERALRHAREGSHVLVGGLGLGFTARSALAQPGVERVTVAEIEPALVQWLRGPLAQWSDGVLADPRCHVQVGDVAALLQPDAGFDAILLDVDNGPSWTVHEDNVGLYSEAGLARAKAALSPGGTLAVWSAQAEPAFMGRMDTVFDHGREEQLQVERDGRRLSYFLYLGERRDGV